MRRGLFAAAAALCVGMAGHGALAQGRGRGGGGNDDDLPPSKPPAIPTLPPTRGISGPRLDPGAVVCQSELDLEHRADVNRRRLAGEADPGNPLENCRLLTQARGVEIIGRHGFNHTEVKLRGTSETGWTDAYLPAS